MLSKRCVIAASVQRGGVTLMPTCNPYTEIYEAPAHFLHVLSTVCTQAHALQRARDTLQSPAHQATAAAAAAGEAPSNITTHRAKADETLETTATSAMRAVPIG